MLFNLTSNSDLLTEFQINLFYGLSAIEIIINISTYFVTIFCFYILVKNPLFHTNLIRLIKCVFIYCMFSQIIRLIMVFQEAQSNSFIGYTRVIFLGMTFGALGTIVFERICATIWLKTYEKTVNNWIFAFSLLCQIPTSFLFAFLVYIDFLDMLICGILILIANFSGYVVLQFLEWFNHKRYNLSLDSTSTYTLSERFQLQENIRTAVLLKKVVILISLCILFIGACVIASQYYVAEFLKRLSYVLLNITFSLSNFAFPLFGISSNPATSQALHKMKSFIPRSKVSSEPERDTEEQKQIKLSNQVRGFDGSKMIFTIDEEREVYFKQLQAGWN